MSVKAWYQWHKLRSSPLHKLWWSVGAYSPISRITTFIRVRWCMQSYSLYDNMYLSVELCAEFQPCSFPTITNIHINICLLSHRYIYFLHDRPWISPSQLSGHWEVISNRLWRHQQNENRASETRGRCVKIVVFIVIYGFVISCKK